MNSRYNSYTCSLLNIDRVELTAKWKYSAAFISESTISVRVKDTSLIPLETQNWRLDIYI